MKKFIQNLTKRFNKDEKGFTLIELIIVIAILAVIVAIAVPNILTAVNNSRKTSDVSNAKIIADAVATVRATYEEHANQAAEFTVNTGGVSAIDSADDDFATKVETLLQHTPKPKYNNESQFDVEVDSAGVITVEIGGHSVYPTVADEYKNK